MSTKYGAEHRGNDFRRLRRWTQIINAARASFWDKGQWKREHGFELTVYGLPIKSFCAAIFIFCLGALRWGNLARGDSK
jgi:hypothetical protein